MQLSSPAFDDHQSIPDTYTAKGAGGSPPLVIRDVPSGTHSLALIMHDPDAPRGDFLHWSLWNVPPGATIWEAGIPPAGAVQGTNDYGQLGYGQPAPPSGTHRYVFELYALDAPLGLVAGASRTDVAAVIQQHILATAQLVGIVSA